MMRRFILAALFVVTIGGSSMALATPQTVSAASKCDSRLLTFPTWYRGLTDGDCNIKSPGSGKDSLSTFIWTIVLNVIEAMLQAVGYLSFGFILYGGFRYITGGGTPDQIMGARKTIVNAVIGLILSFMAVLIVNVIVRGLT